jgi:Heterokaryon incompatibility protein Het-C
MGDLPRSPAIRVLENSREQEEKLLLQDQEARLATGEQSIFDNESTATDPTYSQLAKDDYDNELNEIAGRLPVRISSYATPQIIQLWQPGSVDPRPTLPKILEAFHYPFNTSGDSVVQTLTLTEVSNYVNEQFMSNTATFESNLLHLNASAVAVA